MNNDTSTEKSGLRFPTIPNGAFRKDWLTYGEQKSNLLVDRETGMVMRVLHQCICNNPIIGTIR